MGKLVTIIIPYVKDRGYLSHALKSAKEQTYKNIEIIEIKSSKSLGHNFNAGLSIAKGEYVKILPDDDVLTNNCIYDLVNNIGQADFIHANAVNFYPDGRTEKYIPHLKTPSLKELIQHNWIHGGTTLYKKDSLLKIGGMNTELYTAEEYDLHLNMLANGMKLNYINSTVFLYRRYEGNKSKISDERTKYINEIKRKYSNL
jgi:glycosyltransferase involved in cell wall biosynthesis